MLLTLTACSKEKPGLIIDKVIMGSDFERKNNIIELRNSGESDISLAGYVVKVYNNRNKNKSTNIMLGDKSLGKGQYLTIGISGNTLKDDIKNVIDILVPSLNFNGDDPIVLAKAKNNDLKNAIPVDTIYTVGDPNTMGVNASLIRFPDFPNQTTKFNPLWWCIYNKDFYDLVKKTNPITYDEMLKGPVFDNGSIDTTNETKQIIINGTVGNGKSIKTSVALFIDGDTSRFSDLPKNVRYALMDTPEKSNSPKITKQPWGLKASVATKRILLAAKDNIYLQTTPKGQTQDSFQRHFLLVWANGELVSFKLIKNGLARISAGTHEDSDNIGVVYNNIPLKYWVEMANNYAESKGYHMHNKKLKDPYFDDSSKDFTISEDEYPDFNLD